MNKVKLSLKIKTLEPKASPHNWHADGHARDDCNSVGKIASVAFY